MRPDSVARSSKHEATILPYYCSRGSHVAPLRLLEVLQRELAVPPVSLVRVCIRCGWWPALHVSPHP